MVSGPSNLRLDGKLLLSLSLDQTLSISRIEKRIPANRINYLITSSWY